VRGWISEILLPDSGFIKLSIVYGIAISLLSLATPISVQLLINSVANTALPAPLFTLAAILFILLLIAVSLSALRIHLMALFERRVFSRIAAEITLRAVHAQNPFFTDERRGDLFNRYFDLITVQKALPSLLIGGFTILLQAFVGLAVTSFYHPFFLTFNIVLVICVALIWQVGVGGGIRSAVGLSHAKHEMARWLESVGSSNGFYKSSRHLSFAMDRSEEMTASYVSAHRRHFRFTFTQTLAFMLLYATASAALLALGGWLIIQNQLSIGQLVAAELILSGVFYGISQLGTYIEAFYDLSASLEELSLLYAIPQERLSGPAGHRPSDGALRLNAVVSGDDRFDFSIASGEQLVAVAEPEAQQALALLLKRHIHPARGMVMVGGGDLEAFDMYLLRSDVVVLDRPSIVEVTIREFLRLAQPDGAPSDLMAVIKLVGLESRITHLPNGLDTSLSGSGRPLLIDEVMALKLAAALLRRPVLLFLSPLYDMLPAETLEAALARLKEMGTTVIALTHRPQALALDGYLWIGRHSQERVESADELTRRLRGEDANALSR
jgi:putative ABC transport system ATP-binding protein